MSSDQSSRRGRRFYNNSSNNYRNNGSHSSNYPNNQWSDSYRSQPFVNTNDRNFNNYSQNYSSNETQDQQNSGTDNNVVRDQQKYDRRQRYGGNGGKRYNYERYGGNSRPNVETQNQRSAANNETPNEGLGNASNAGASHSNTGNNSYSNRSEQTVNRKESNEENGRKSYNRSHDRNYGKQFDKNYSNFRDFNKKYENKNEYKKESKKENKLNDFKHLESDETQREIMDELLRKGEFECMVCCDTIKTRDGLWNCGHCYNSFHLKCIKMWAISQSSNGQTSGDLIWRCPACQADHYKIPARYLCFCGKIRDPELNRYIVPHSCGEMCGRKRKEEPNKKYNCQHKCLLLCHPGPCPPCQSKVVRECACGQTKISVNCATNDEDVICNKICNKQLDCGQHYCQKVCHSSACGECDVINTQNCFCGQNKREVKCSKENNLIQMFCCLQKCNQTLNCGNHRCEQLCHFDKCNDCSLTPDAVTHCSCGKTELKYLIKNKRKTCTDPIPTCDQICDKELVCGPEKERHRCKNKCHSGPCPPCALKSIIRCRCGANSDSIECIELNEENKTFICKKRCNRKRVCGRHKCLNECCIDSQHKCEQICGKKLSCGTHTCQELCHNGVCPQCWNINWDEMTCRCGTAITLPPIACGTKRPECGLICSRRHDCDHPIDHNCHDDDECPPCTYFVPKLCYGGHEGRPVPCYETGFSCGYLCGKPLDCGLHECQMICHFGDCNECTLPCNKTREDCEHLCALKCHQKTSTTCPKSNCKIMLKVFCDCGRKTDQMPCFKVNDENSLRISMNTLANARIKNGESINVMEIMKNIKDFKFIQLKCDEKCAVFIRNKQLAEALDIKDANFSPDPGPPKYSDLLKNGARTDPTFVTDIYEKLTKLVIESKQSKLNFKNLNFPPMNSENRHIVHELAEYFGCKTHAIDREPNRSVVVKASKDKCYLPTVHLMDIIKGETESRKTAINRSKITLKSCSFDNENNETNNTNLSTIRNIADSILCNQNTQQIDYFDFKGD